MQFRPNYKQYIASLFIIILAIACSTEKDALLNKGYHNMTARYNGYYNAGVIIDEELTVYRDGYQEDYTKILPLDRYPSEIDAVNLTPGLEDAIERCSKVIVRHSMPNPQFVKNKKKEDCRWIDDNWVVIGHAYYIKRDYAEAKQKLKYVSESQFYNGETSVYEARIWLARTYIALKEYGEANRILVSLKQSMEQTASVEKEKPEKKKKLTKYQKKRQRKAAKDDKDDAGPAPFPKELKLEYELTMGELYMAQDENKKAITHIENAVKLCKNKKRRARYMFVLAQMYAEQGDDSQASLYFEKVSRSNAPYEMRFKAKIKNALSATGNSEDLVKELNKMLKDGKNSEYKDQIYYALAELDMKKPDVKAAKLNYSNSVLWSVKNNRQKGVSYLRLADLHFDETDYVNAQRYYDSCVQVIPKDYPGYEGLQSKAEGLSDLVFHYETVTFQDSVQRIANMSPKEREKFLQKTLKDIETKKERERIEAERRLIAQQARINQQSAATNGGTGGGKKWYFSNPKQVASGFTDFRSLWGQRKLEDDWRRTDKATSEQFVDENGEAIDSVVENSLTVAELMQDIPLTQAAIDSSNNKILTSLYNLGLIYKEQLKEEEDAKNYFHAVLDRNIEHPQVLPSHYQLYLLYKKKGNSKSEFHKSEIINKYGDSEIAQILKDPDYLKKKELKDREELDAYSNLLRAYNRRSYASVITACNEVITNQPKNQFINKYYLLKAFALSKITPGNTTSISEPLEKIYAKAPTSEEGKQAKIYLDKLKKGEDIVPPDDKTETPVTSPYVFKEKSKHFFILSFPNETEKISETKNKISDFNKEFYRNDGLTLQNAPLGKEQILVVRSFKDITKAKIYMNSFTSDKAKEILGSIPTDFKICIISPKNFTTLFKSKDFDEYMTFYKDKY